MPFFVDSTATAKVETTPALPEKETSVSEASQQDEKQPAVFDQKSNSPEQSPDGSPIQVTTKAEEKARQPVVLNPVTHQQVLQPQEGKPVPPLAAEESAKLPLKSDLDLAKEIASNELSSVPSQPVSTQNKGLVRTPSPVDSVESVVPPSGTTKRRFIVKKVEDPVLNSSSSSELKLENKETELAVNTSSNANISSRSEVASDSSKSDISTQPESEPEQKLSGEAVLPHGNLSTSQQISGNANTLQQGQNDVLKSDIQPLMPASPSGDQLQINFEIETSKVNGEQLQLESASSPRPQTPTYAFHPVDNSISDEQALPHNFKFESQLSGEEQNVDKPKSESVASSDDELTANTPTEKSGAPPHVSEFVQGRFIVSMSSDRIETPLLENSEQVKPPVHPVEITLQDVTGAVGSDSIPSLTPSSSMESLNSVGSQTGAQNAHSFSSSPQTILPEGQSSTNLATVANKDQARKNSGQSDLLNDGVKQVKQEGEQGRQTSEQVQI